MLVFIGYGYNARDLWIDEQVFPKPLRKVTDRATKFRLETGGWGVFRIHARIHLKEGRDFRLHHDLELHYDDNSANTK